MEVVIDTDDGIVVIALNGELDGAAAPGAQQQIMPHAQPGVKMMIDMGSVSYMSSAGIRMLLSTYRQVTGNGGKIVVVALADDVRDTLSVTGFLTFFEVADTREAALEILA